MELENVQYEYSRRARRVNVRITANRIRVSVPMGMQLSVAEKFVAQNAEKIAARQQRMRQSNKVTHQISPDAPLRTLTFTAEARPDDTVPGQSVHFRFTEGRLLMCYPPSMALDSLQPVFWKGINYYLTKEARRVLPQRVAELSERAGLPYAGLKIQSSRTHWGSCSSRGSLNLSRYLLLLPEHLVDYIILHELCHTVEMNHGPRFHAMLDQLTGGRELQLREELKQYHIPDR